MKHGNLAQKLIARKISASKWAGILQLIGADLEFIAHKPRNFAIWRPLLGRNTGHSRTGPDIPVETGDLAPICYFYDQSALLGR